MAKNQVTLTFAGDSTDLERSFDRVGSASEDMGRKVEDTADRFDRVGESADNLDTRAMGFRDTLTGVEDSFRGFNIVTGRGNREAKQLEGQIDDLKNAMEASGGGTEEQKRQLEALEGQLAVTKERTGGLFDGILMLGFGFGDLASGIANFGTMFTRQTLEFVANTARMVASNVAAVATTIAGWVAQGAAALASGAQMAAAWLIGLGPIGLVIAAIGAIIAILALLGVDFEDVKNAIGAGWAFIKGAAEGVFNWLKENWPLVLAIITGPIGIAVLVISRHWQTIKDGASSLFSTIKNAATSAKDWIVEKFGEVVDFFQGLPGTIEDAFTGVGSSIVNGIKSVWNSTVGGFGFTVPSWVPGVGGRGFHIPELARGGIVTRPTLALIGEAGPEAVVPLNRVGSGGGEVNITINVQGSVLSERDLLRVVRDELQRGGFQGMVRAA